MGYMPRIEPTILLGILSTAVESGSCDIGLGWAQVEKFQWRWWYQQPDGSDGWGDDIINPNIDKDTPLMAFRDVAEWDEDDYEDKAEEPFIPVTLKSLQDATRWAILNYSKWFTFSCNGGTITDIDYDAVGADIILQKAVLGEVIYG